MPGTKGGESPSGGVAGDVGPQATEAFKILGNETRLAILLALWDASDPYSSKNTVSFSELRERVGIRQGAQFNYHLEKLVGRFVEKTEVGYGLKRSGLVLVQSIIAGTGIEEPTLDRTAVDAACTYCGAQVAITYANHSVYMVCTECEGFATEDDDHPAGTLTAWSFEPTGLADRTAEEVYTASTVKAFSRIAQRFESICPECSGPIEWSFDVCESHDATAAENCPDCGRRIPILAQEVCTVCKSSGMGPPGIKTLLHPAVIAFYYDHGIEIGFTGDSGFEDVVRTMELVDAFEEEVVSTDPLRVRVEIEYEGDTLTLLLDESVRVLEVTRRDGSPA